MLTRRLWLASAAASVGCAGTPGLRARPEAVVKDSAKRGLYPFGLAVERDGLCFVPEKVNLSAPVPLLVFLHGANGRAERAIRIVREQAEAAGVVLIVPESRGVTWDAVQGGFGPDVEFVDRVLKWTFSRFLIDPRHVAIGGFSDGATYALSLGLPNGGLFTHILAFSPGFVRPSEPQGEPSIFISHGTNDQILPIDQCSRRILPVLKKMQYRIEYREFDGPHAAPKEIADAAMKWFLN